MSCLHFARATGFKPETLVSARNRGSRTQGGWFVNWSSKDPEQAYRSVFEQMISMAP